MKVARRYLAGRLYDNFRTAARQMGMDMKMWQSTRRDEKLSICQAGAATRLPAWPPSAARIVYLIYRSQLVQMIAWHWSFTTLAIAWPWWRSMVWHVSPDGVEIASLALANWTTTAIS